MKSGTQNTPPRAENTTCMMTGMGRQSGWTTEAEDGETFCGESHDLSSAKPLGGPAQSVLNGPMTGSRSTGSKVASRMRIQNRTTKKEKLMKNILEQ